MRYVELRYLPDGQFVSDGFIMFVWGSYENTQLPIFRPQFGIALDIADEAEVPQRLSLYNPETGRYAPRLADDHVPELAPYYTAVWDNRRWKMAARSEK